MSEVIAGVRIPDSKLARAATDLLREHGTPLLFAHSLRVYLFGAIRGRHRGWTIDHELLYFGAVFHDLGLTANEGQSLSLRIEMMRPRGLSTSMAGRTGKAISLQRRREILRVRPS